MKKNIKNGSLVFCLFMFINMHSAAQKISETRYTYISSCTESEYEIVQWIIYNNTNEKMLLWFEKESTNQNMPIKDKVRKYFFSLKVIFLW